MTSNRKHGRLALAGSTILVSAVLFAAPALAQSSAAPYLKAQRYNAAGQVTATISPSASGATGPFIATRTTYDSGGRPVGVEEGSLSAWQPDSIAPANWGATFTLTRRVEIAYDAQDRKVSEKVIGSDGVAVSLTQYSYDVRGRLECTAVRMNPAAWAALPASACTPGAAGSQGSDRITRNVYDGAGQLIQVRKAVGTPIEQAYATYSYSANGKPQAVIDANGNRAQYEYDGFDRLTKWALPSPTRPAAFNPATVASALSSAGSVNATDYEQYGYDAADNKVSMRKRDGSVLTFAYDNLNRVTAKLVPERSGLSATHTRDVYYGYDLRGLQTYARFDSPSGEGISTSYDGFGRETTSTLAMDATSRTLGSVYDLQNNRTQLTYPDGNTVTYSYDALDRPTAILRSGTASIAGYSYDAAGRRTGMSGGVSTNLGYDNAGRLNLLAHTMPASTSNNQWTFTFNAGGQIASQTRSNDSFAFTGRVNVSRSYTANGLNQYGVAGPATFCYDANGNLTADGSSVFLYDVENRLVEKRAQGTGNGNCASLSYAGALQAGLRYDPAGRLYEVTGPSGTTRMLYDGDALAAEYDGTGNLLRRYVHGADGQADDPVAWFEGSGFAATNQRVLRSNWQGSIVLVTDAAASTVLAVNRYDEYGIPQSGNAGRFQYTGQAWIPDLGMYYYKARIYSPTLGRFLQTDPIGYEDQINLYAYVGNDPVNRMDPTGTSCSGFDAGDTSAYCDRGNPDMDGPEISVEAQRETTQLPPSGQISWHGLTIDQPGNYADSGTLLTVTPQNGQSKKKSECDLVAEQPGKVFVDFGSASFVAGYGASGSVGVFRNLRTGSNGFFYTIGGNLGFEAGAGFSGGFYRSAADLRGLNANVNVSAAVSGSANFSLDGRLVGGSLGQSGRLGGSVSISNTVFFGCNYYGG